MTRPRRKIERPRVPGAPLTIDQAAELLNLAPGTVRQRIAEGKLRAYRDGRLVRIAEDALYEYQHTMMGKPAPPPGEMFIRKHLKPRRKA